MALTVGTPVAVTSSLNVVIPRIAKVATDVAAIAYKNNTSTEVSAKVCNITTGSIVLGTQQQVLNVGLNASDLAIWQTISNKFCMINGKTGFNGAEGVIVARSGDTLTEGTPDEFIAVFPSVEPTLGVGTSGTVALSLYLDNGTTPQYVDFSISGDSITAGTPEAPAGSVSDPLGTVGMDSDDTLSMYANGLDLTFQMVNLTSGISQGTASDSTHDLVGGYSKVNMWNYSLARLSDTQAICCFPRDDTTDALSLMTINRSGTTISSYGTPLDVYTDTGGGVLYGAIAVIDSSTILLFYRDANADEQVQTFSISGDTITANGDTAPVSTTWTGMGGAILLDTGEAVICWEDGSGNIQSALITGFGGPAGITHSAGGIPGSILVTS